MGGCQPVSKNNSVKISQEIQKPHIKTWEVGTMTVAAIIALGALIVGPVTGTLALGPVAVVAGHMVMTAPFIVITGSGLIAAGYLCMQLKRRGNRMLQLWITRNPEAYKAWRGKLLFRDMRPDSETVEQARDRNARHRQRTLTWLSPGTTQAHTETLETSDGVKLDAVWSPQKNAECSPTAIIFHGQRGTLDYMYRWGNWYHRLGMNVLMVSTRGYGCSEGDPRTSGAEGLERDARAALDFAKSKGCSDKILAHGYSMGGVSALSLGKEEGVRVVTADHTFDTLENAASNSAKRYKVIPDSTVRMLATTLFPKGMANTERVQKLRGTDTELQIFYGERDKTTGKGASARALMHARYNITSGDNMISIPGGHNAFKNFFHEKDLNIQGDTSFTQAPTGDPREREGGLNKFENSYIHNLRIKGLLPSAYNR